MAIRRNWLADLPRKTAVALALFAIAGVALWLGGWAMWALVSAAALLMMAEWVALARPARDVSRRLPLLALFAPLSLMAPIAAGPGFLAIGLAGAAAIFTAAVTRDRRIGSGVLYVAIPCAAVLWLREQPGGGWLAFWTLATVWATDIGGYFAGRAIGGPKLAPRLSPNKTWAGLIGGMALAFVVGQLFAGAERIDDDLALTAPVLAVIAQAGDLYESGVKRRAGAKDSGTLLPGHGGVLDRVDGLVTVAPAVALLILLSAVL